MLPNTKLADGASYPTSSLTPTHRVDMCKEEDGWLACELVKIGMQMTNHLEALKGCSIPPQHECVNLYCY